MPVITYSNVEEETRKFCRCSNPAYKSSTVRNLLIKTDDKSKEYAKNSFLYYLKNISGGGDVDADLYADAVQRTVQSYLSNKDSAIDIFKRLTARLEQKFSVSLPVPYPPVPVANTFERLMYISKYVQDPENRISDLQDILWVSSRTIEDDLAKLRGMDDDPIQICGKKYVIRDMERRADRVTDILSTPHPFFLTCNLTQVIVMLQGLRKMTVNQELKAYAEKTAGEIWEQLSDYGRNRILYVMENLMPDEISWYKNLGNMGKESFWPEYRCSAYGAGAMMECLKNGKTCNIEYKTEEGICFLKEALVKKLVKEEFLIEAQGREFLLNHDQIIRSASSAEEMF